MDNSAARSRVLTLVFTDLAGSTALKTERGDAVVGDLIRRHRELITRLAGECSGRIIDWAGDGCFLTFEVSSAGVLFALRLQEAHVSHADLPSVRIGIHLGEVTELVDNGGPTRVEGLAVDIASRVCNLAAPRQVLMTSAVYQSARQRLGVETLGKPVVWQSYGPYELKGIGDSVEITEAAIEGLQRPFPPEASEKAWPAAPATRVKRRTGRAWAIAFLVLIAAMVGYALIVAKAVAPMRDLTTSEGPHIPGPPDGRAEVLPSAIRSLAVLPLDNMSDDPEQDHFADGMTEALIAELAKVRSIRVISRTSVMQYKGTTKTIREIAQELGVDAVVEGSVLKDGTQVRITAQLIHGATDEHLWANNYIGSLEGVLQLQARVALEITDEIEAVVTPEEREQLASARPVNIEAYETYAQGRYFWGLRTRESFDAARGLFEKSLALDPAFGLAHAGLADVYSMMAEYAMMPAHDAYARAREEAQAALALDPKLGEAYTSLALVLYVYDWKWAQAEEAFRKSVSLSPGYATAHHWYAVYLYSVGRNEEALREIQLAYERDPISPVIAITVAEFLAAAGRNDEAIAQAEAVLRMNPHVYRLHLGVANMYDRLGEFPAALDAAQRALEGNPASSLLRMRVAYAQARAGHPEEAQQTLDGVLAEPAAQLLPQTLVARCYVALGQTDRAFEWIEQAFTAKDPSLPRIMTQPVFASVEHDPRFRGMLRRINFPGADTTE